MQTHRRNWKPPTRALSCGGLLMAMAVNLLIDQRPVTRLAQPRPAHT